MVYLNLEELTLLNLICSLQFKCHTMPTVIYTHFKWVLLLQLDKIAFISLLFWGEDSIYPLQDILLSFRVYVKLRHTFAQTHTYTHIVDRGDVRVWVLFPINSNSMRQKLLSEYFVDIEVKSWFVGLKTLFWFGRCGWNRPIYVSSGSFILIKMIGSIALLCFIL